MAERVADLAALDARLLEAARSGDAAALADGYRLAAQHVAAGGNPDAAGFFLTQAYVWALVAGEAATALGLAQALRAQGRLD